MSEFKLNIAEIIKIIPHRYPLLLVDKIIELEKATRIVGIKNITFNEPQFMGHFPDNPIMPGVLIIEAMAQVSAILAAHEYEGSYSDKEIYFMSIDNAKFRKVVIPGDRMEIESIVERSKMNVWKFNCVAKVDGEIVSEAKIMAMIKNKVK